MSSELNLKEVRNGEFTQYERTSVPEKAVWMHVGGARRGEESTWSEACILG